MRMCSKIRKPMSNPLIPLRHMKRYLFLLTALLGILATGFAQNAVEITGTVTDETGEAIIGANVVV